MRDCIDDLMNIVKKLDLTKINTKIINSNIDTLVEIYLKIKNILKKFSNTKVRYMTFIDSSNDYSNIKSILNNSIIGANKQIRNIVSKSHSIHCLKYEQISLYWFESNNEPNIKSKNYEYAIRMLKIIWGMGKLYKISFEKNERIFIWVPIEKKRNYNSKQISKSGLKKSSDEFEAFVASGVTFSVEQYNMRITIITRYEEIEKLLIHELLHNFGIDGNNFHSELKSIISKYTKIKNPNLNKKNFNYEYSIYESYTELLSTYYYLIFLNIEIGISENEIRDKLFGQVLTELIYSYNTICNLISMNGYSKWKDFIISQSFGGNICTYEYYYLKGLMYNNFEIKFNENLEKKYFIDVYSDIICMCEKINNSSDKLLEQMFNFYSEQQNFKYQLH